MSMKIDIDTSNYDATISVFRSKLPAFVPRLIIAGSHIIKENMQNEVRVRTGTLKASVREDIFPDHADITTNSGYGLYHDQGHRAFDVVPVNALALRIPLPSGAIIFRKKVHIPAVEGEHYVERTLQNFTNQFPDEIEGIYNELF